MKGLRAWLGIDQTREQEHTALRDAVEALDHLEPDRARQLAAFAYLLGRVAHADQHVSPAETEAMERHVMEQGQLTREQALLVVQLAKTNNLLFGGTANYLVARDFGANASYDEKMGLMRCLFALAATDDSISLSEEGEIHKLARELKIQHEDLVNLRVTHRRHLPGLSR